MTHRERIISALNHREEDIIPYAVSYTLNCRERLTKYFGSEDFESRYRRMIVAADYSARPTPVPGKPEHFIDDFGVIWNRSGVDKDIGMIDRYVIEDIEGWDYEFPQVDENWLRGLLDEFTASDGGAFKEFSFGFTLFERAWSLCGMENVLAAMLTCPEELERLLDAICDFNLRVIDIALEYSGSIDAIHFGDDWGQQKNLIMGQKHWRHFIKPRLKRMYDRVKSRGLYVIQHSCGDIGAIFEDLIEIGLDCYQTFQPEIYDIERVKEAVGDRLSFWGGISTQRLLAAAPPDEVRAETIRIMKIMGKGGGYIAAPTHAVPGDVPPENIEAMLDIFENQKKYL